MGIGRFRLSGKTPTQTNNETGMVNGGQTERPKGRQGALVNRGQRSERVLVTSSTVGGFQ